MTADRQRVVLATRVLRAWIRHACPPPRTLSLGFLTLGGFVAGVFFWGGFNTVAGSHQHREVLHDLPRDEDQRLRGAEGHDPLHQPLGRARDLPGLPRAARVDRQDRPQDAGLEGGLGPDLRHASTRATSSWTLRRHLAEHEWARMKANDSLECRNCHSARIDGPDEAEPARGRTRTSASCSPARGPASTATRASPTSCRTCPGCRDGNDAPGYFRAGRVGPALPGRRGLGSSSDDRSGGGSARAAGTQLATGSGRREFLRLAHSAAVLQAQAAELAASRDTRPEVRAFARRMAEFRREQIASLLSAARERTLAVSPVPPLEHKVILENLEPLISAEGLVSLSTASSRLAKGMLPNSWVGTGPNKSVAPNDLEQALGPDVMSRLSLGGQDFRATSFWRGYRAISRGPSTSTRPTVVCPPNAQVFPGARSREARSKDVVHPATAPRPDKKHDQGAAPSQKPTSRASDR